MRGNNRKSIEKCRKRLPQFTTMNVIDGQAGLVIYSSLIFYSLTIDNILNIIVLLILAGVTIATLTGDNGILTRASNAQDEHADATVREAISLAWNEYQIEINDATGEIVENGTKIASTTQVRIQGKEEEYLATSSMSFLDYLKQDEKGYIDENGVVNVQALVGEKLSKGNGTDGETDVYILTEDEDMYVLKYYDSEGIPATEDLWSVNKVSSEEAKEFEKPDYNEMMQALKPGDYVKYNTSVKYEDDDGVEQTEEVELECRVLYDASSEYGLQIVTSGCVDDSVGLGYESGYQVYNDSSTVSGILDAYNNAISKLNSTAKEWSNDDYVLDARCIGSNPKYKNNETNTTVIHNEYDTKLKGEDKNYETDYEELVKLNLLNTDEQYWLASRYNEEGDVYYQSGIQFGLRCEGGEENSNKKIYLAGERGNGWYQGREEFCGLRPVFLLRGNLKITGDGTENSPYELGV